MPDLSLTILKILGNIEALLPQYMAIEEDRLKANGSVSACIMDADGNIYGRIFGEDKVLGRERQNVKKPSFIYKTSCTICYW